MHWYTYALSVDLNFAWLNLVKTVLVRHAIAFGMLNYAALLFKEVFLVVFFCKPFLTSVGFVKKILIRHYSLLLEMIENLEYIYYPYHLISGLVNRLDKLALAN